MNKISTIVWFRAHHYTQKHRPPMFAAKLQTNCVHCKCKGGAIFMAWDKPPALIRTLAQAFSLADVRLFYNKNHVCSDCMRKYKKNIL